VSPQLPQTSPRILQTTTSFGIPPLCCVTGSRTSGQAAVSQYQGLALGFGLVFGREIFFSSFSLFFSFHLPAPSTHFNKTTGELSAMKAARYYGKEDIRIEHDVEVAQVGEGEVKVVPAFVGICGTGERIESAINPHTDRQSRSTRVSRWSKVRRLRIVSSVLTENITASPPSPPTQSRKRRSPSQSATNSAVQSKNSAQIHPPT
jgi:hypothetical protein